MFKTHYPLIKERLINYREFLDKLGQENNFKIIDLMDTTGIDIYDNLMDGIHPNLKLSKAMGKYISTKLLQEV